MLPPARFDETRSAEPRNSFGRSLKSGGGSTLCSTTALALQLRPPSARFAFAKAVEVIEVSEVALRFRSSRPQQMIQYHQ